MKTRVTNIEPFHAELKIGQDGNFSIWFFSSAKSDFNKRHVYKVHLKSYWLRFIASMLWKVQKHKLNEAALDAKALHDE